MDQTLFLGGMVCLLIAGTALLDYLVRQGGSVFDPISISWAGFIAFVPGGLFSTAVFRETRATLDIAGWGVTVTLIGLISYLAGIYSGKGVRLARAIPTPAKTLTSTQIFGMWCISVPLFAATALAGVAIPSGLVTVFQGLVMGSLGTITLVSLLGVLSRSNLFIKFLMASSSIACSLFVLSSTWSRRPLVGIAAAALAFFYREKIMRKSLAFRGLFLMLILVAGVVLLQYLTVTRGDRFHGVGTVSMFSAAGIENFLGGIVINYEVYEFILDRFPEQRAYLYGSGFVPAFLFFIPRSIWPTKPFSSGHEVTCMWYQTTEPENNLAPLFIGEAYCNFGVFGVILILFITGRIVRVFNTYMVLRNDNQTVWLAWLMVTPDFATEWRGDFTSMTVQGLLRVLVFLGLAWFINLMSGQRAQSPVTSGYQRLYNPGRY